MEFHHVLMWAFPIFVALAAALAVAEKFYSSRGQQRRHWTRRLPFLAPGYACAVFIIAGYRGMWRTESILHSLITLPLLLFVYEAIALGLVELCAICAQRNL
jgi:hypothetical protein